MTMCGKLPDGTCALAGTEQCDIKCQLRDLEDRVCCECGVDFEGSPDDDYCSGCYDEIIQLGP